MVYNRGGPGQLDQINERDVDLVPLSALLSKSFRTFLLEATIGRTKSRPLVRARVSETEDAGETDVGSASAPGE